MTTIRDILAVNLRWHRKKQGFSQTEIATRAKVDRTYISDLERSQCAATIDVVGRLAEALGINANDLLICPSLFRKPDSFLRIIPPLGPDKCHIVEIPLTTSPLSECSALLLSFFAYPELNSTAYLKRLNIERAICNTALRERIKSDPEWGLCSQTLRPFYLIMAERSAEKAISEFNRQAKKRFAVAQAVSNLIDEDPSVFWMKKPPEEGYYLHLTKMTDAISSYVKEKDVKNILFRVWAPGFSVVHVSMALRWLHLYSESSDDLESIVRTLCSNRDSLKFILNTAELFRVHISLNCRSSRELRSMIQFKAT